MTQIMSAQSGTTDSTDVVSEGTESPVKKTKIMLTEEKESLVKKFQSAVSKIEKMQKLTLRQVSGRGFSFIQSEYRDKHDGHIHLV